jgi:hypothetical protein
MPRYTFRTEGPFVGEKERVETLVQELGLSIVKHWVEYDRRDWALDFFTVETEIDDVEVLRAKMTELILNDPRFEDLHRCEQTLNPGDAVKDPF